MNTLSKSNAKETLLRGMTLQTFMMFVATLIGVMSLVSLGSVAEGASVCAPEITRFCSGISSQDLDAMAGCLKKHKSELSADCLAMGKELRGKPRNFMQACGDDVKKVCPSSAIAHQTLASCMKKNIAALLPECKAMVQKFK